MFALLSPKSPVVAGTPVIVHLRYTHEGPTLAPGAALRIGFNQNDGAYLPPGIDGAAVVSVAGDAVLKSVGSHWRRSITFYAGAGVSDLLIIDLEITGRGVKAGEQVDIILGRDADGQPCFIPGVSCDSPLQFFYHLDPDRRFSLVALHPDAPNYLQYLTEDGVTAPDWQPTGAAIQIIPDLERQVDLALPSVAEVGEKVNLRVVVYDRFSNQIPHFRSRIELAGTATDAAEIRLADADFNTGENGFALLPVEFGKTGLTKDISFRLSGLGVCNANPVRVVEKTRRQVYWGELHGHCCLSDGGVRGPEEFFKYARDIRGLDFAALADHSFGLAVGNHWERLLTAIATCSKDPDFVPILGYEILTNGYGHRNVYFSDLTGRLVMADYQPGSGGSFQGEDIPAYRKIWNPAFLKVPTVAAFLAALEGTDFLYTAHHCGDLAPAEAGRVVLYEACSEWGISEEGFRQNTCTTMLPKIFADGMSPGLTGGSDDHRAKAGFRGGGLTPGPLRWPSGLTAVFADRLDRSAIFNALRRKQCYATTGARIMLEPEVTRTEHTLRVRLQVCGTAFIERVWVMKNGKPVFHQYGGPSSQWSLNWKDDDFNESDTCYVRITQADGEVAWINPLPFAPAFPGNKLKRDSTEKLLAG